MSEPERPAGLQQALLGIGSDAIIATDAQGIITFWNPGAVRIFGFAAEHALGRSLDIIIPESLRARHWHGFSTHDRNRREPLRR
jgi:PAS domain S-box-containing protein